MPTRTPAGKTRQVDGPWSARALAAVGCAVIALAACGDEGIDEATETDFARCVLGADGCPSDCGDIRARPYDPASGATCLGDFEIIGCYPSNTQITADFRCAKSAEGRIHAMSGSYVRHLIRREGFSSCSEGELAEWIALDLCDP